jgi:uridine kinase
MRVNTEQSGCTSADDTEGIRKMGTLIGIGGGSGSGKTLLARNLFRSLGGSSEVCLIELDSYYRDFPDLPVDERARKNFDHPDAFDMELLYLHLRDLLAGRAIDRPIYDYRTHSRSPKTERVGPHEIAILEGILVFTDPRVRDLMDIKVYVDSDLDICFIRRLRRDMKERSRTVESVIEQWESTVKPMFLEFIEPAKRYADVIIPGGGENEIAIDLLKAGIQALLAHGRSARTVTVGMESNPETPEDEM